MRSPHASSIISSPRANHVIITPYLIDSSLPSQSSVSFKQSLLCLSGIRALFPSDFLCFHGICITYAASSCITYGASFCIIYNASSNTIYYASSYIIYGASSYTTYSASFCITFALSEFRPVVITGEVETEERAKIVDRFQNDSKCRVLVATIGACGTGLTLTAASVEVFLDEAWYIEYDSDR